MSIDDPDLQVNFAGLPKLKNAFEVEREWVRILERAGCNKREIRVLKKAECTKRALTK